MIVGSESRRAFDSVYSAASGYVCRNKAVTLQSADKFRNLVVFSIQLDCKLLHLYPGIVVYRAEDVGHCLAVLV